MKKKIYLVLTLSLLFILTSCGKKDINEYSKDLKLESVKAEGSYISREFEVEDFDKVSVYGTFDVYYSVGEEVSVEAKMHESFLDNLSVSVVGDNLEIRSMKNFIYKDIKDEELPKIYITSPIIEEVEVGGVVGFYGQNTITASDFKFNSTGAGEASLDLDVENLSVDISGAYELYLRGKVKKLGVNIAGAGELDALDLETDISSIVLSGAGETRVSVKDELEASISGVGKIAYKGDPVVEKKISGVGELIKLD